MPIYEYVCRQCGTELERLQRLSDAPLSDCPECGEATLKRKVSAAGFRLSGGGWYETDFKADGKRNIAGEKDSGEKSGTREKGGDSGDKKSGSSDSGGKSDKGGKGDKTAESGSTNKTGTGDA